MGEIIRYGVLSDSHGRVPPSVFDALEGVRRIFHCGDIGSETLAIELGAIAPVSAVRGNMDSRRIGNAFPETFIDEMEFGIVAMAHGGRYSHDNRCIMNGLEQLFAAAKPRLILFGHSHQPTFAERGRTLFVNPGSVSIPHHGDPPTLAIVSYDVDADDLNAEHVVL